MFGYHTATYCYQALSFYQYRYRCPVICFPLFHPKTKPQAMKFMGSSNAELDLNLTLRPPGKTSTTRNQNYDASSRKKINTCGGVPWSDLNHDLLYLVMMRLGVFDFLSFSEVCKSWRSLAVSTSTKFMASKPPLLMYISFHLTCHMTVYFQDFERRRFQTLIPQLVGRKCVGLTCGYLILFGQETRDFFLVNPFTRHELHFPGVTFDVNEVQVRSVLVFSPSKDEWVFIVTNKRNKRVWYSIAGKGAWNHVFSREQVLDLHSFKGKIYALNQSWEYPLCEMRLDPVPKLTVLDTPLLDSVSYLSSFVSSEDNLYILSEDMYKVQTQGFDKQNWVPCEKTRQEYAELDDRLLRFGVAEPESWAAPSSQYQRFFNNREHGKDKWWYFPHDCLNVNLIDE